MFQDEEEKGSPPSTNDGSEEVKASFTRSTKTPCTTQALADKSDKYYKKFDFFYKRTCFRLFSEYFKHIFHPYQKEWVDQRKKADMSRLLQIFAQKYFG